MDIAIAIIVGIAAVVFVSRAALALRRGDPQSPEREGPPTQPLDVAWRMAEADRIFEQATAETPTAWAKELQETVARDCDRVPAWLDTDSAHRLIQVHLECSSVQCSARRAALDVLRLSGHYVPAQRSEERDDRRSA